LLDEFGIKATFFVLGSIADELPEIVREIACRGHEIASKGYAHRGLDQMPRNEFREDATRAREALERAVQRKIAGYRIAQGSIRLEDLWALEILAEEGFVYDSSMYPRFRSIAAQPWSRFPHVRRFGEREIREFPLSTWGPDGFLFPVAGGNYFRQFPTRLMRRAVADWTRLYKSPFNMYFNVWELDPNLPRIAAAGPLTSIRQYRNLRKMPGRLRYFFKRYRFQSIASLIGLDESPETSAFEPPSASPIEIRTPSRPASETVTASGVDSRIPATIVVPCFNEERILPYLDKTLRELRDTLGKSYALRYVFVDDASRDETWRGLERLFGDRPDCDLVHHKQNQGVGAAILTGIRHARSDIVCSIDCDCSYDPQQLAGMIPMLEDGVAMVTASPYHPLGATRGVPASRLFLSRGLSSLYRIVLRQKLATYTSCFRVYARSAVAELELREAGFLGIPETLAILDRRGARIVEYPAALEVRLLGRSKMRTMTTILGHLKLLARLALARLQAGDSRRQSDARA
jgi:polysaccharide deacetylase family protein (PEP-CTERM system associated)